MNIQWVQIIQMNFQVHSVQFIQQCFTSNQYFKSQAMTSSNLPPQTANRRTNQAIAAKLYYMGANS